MSQAASAASTVYAPNFGAAPAVPTAPTVSVGLGSVNLPVVIGAVIAAVALVFYLRKK